MFYGSPSAYLWEDDCGVAHRIPQGEGGDQHIVLVSAKTRLESDKLMAFLDDVYIISPELDHVGNGYAVVQHELFHHAKVQIKAKCGTGQECVRKCATFWSRWQESPTPALGC